MSEPKVVIEKLEKSKRKISIVLSWDDFFQLIKKAAKELSKEVKLNGFREGKIPFEVMERTLGKERLLAEGTERAVKKHYVDAILDNSIKAIGQPKVQIKKIAWGNDLEFEAEVAELGEFFLGDWRKTAAKVNAKYQKDSFKVKEEEIQRELDFLASQRAKLTTVDRMAKIGDQLEIDFVVLIDNVPIEGGTAKKHQLVLGEKKFIPGFEDQLVGLLAGAEKKFELKFPEDYHSRNLAGKKATFEVKVGLVQERELPKIDDDFARGIGKFKSLEELKKNIKEGIIEEHKNDLRRKREVEMIEAVVEGFKGEIPDILIDEEVHRMIHEIEDRATSMGISKKDYFEKIGKSEDELKAGWRKKEALNRVRAALFLEQLAKEENINPSSEEIEEQMNRMIQYFKTFGDVEKNLDLKALYNENKYRLTQEKVFDLLLSVK